MAKTASRKAPAGRKPPVREAPKKKRAVASKKEAVPARKRAAQAPVKKQARAKQPRTTVEPPVVTVEPPVSTEPAPRELPSGEPAGDRALPFEVDPKRVEESLRKLGEELRHWANKGRYTKVRFKFRGRQLLPDLPIAAVAAAEGLTFYWGGILRALIFNMAGRSLLEVELVNDADKRVRAGKEALLSGDVDEALAFFREALAMDRDNAGAYLHMGVALKLKGDREGALAAFERAKALDAEGPVGAEAERLAAPLRPQGTVVQAG
jgi:hypothetical protein